MLFYINNSAYFSYEIVDNEQFSFTSCICCISPLNVYAVVFNQFISNLIITDCLKTFCTGARLADFQTSILKYLFPLANFLSEILGI